MKNKKSASQRISEALIHVIRFSNMNYQHFEKKIQDLNSTLESDKDEDSEEASDHDEDGEEEVGVTRRRKTRNKKPILDDSEEEEPEEEHEDVDEDESENEEDDGEDEGRDTNQYIAAIN